MKEILLRFALGGLIVSSFAILGDLFKPKSFAGLFGAAPAVALATIVLTVAKEGRSYTAIEARSMVLGAFAFLLYAWIVCRALLPGKWSALRVTLSALPIWCASAFGLWVVFLR
jgi:hypothetical protein